MYRQTDGEGKMDIQNMADIMGKLDATNCSSEEAIAEFILGNLIGYRKNVSQRPNDKAFIVIAIQAYAKLLQDNGVKVA